MIYTPVSAVCWLVETATVEPSFSESLWLMNKIFHIPQCAISFFVSCLVVSFGFVSGYSSCIVASSSPSKSKSMHRTDATIILKQVSHPR